MDQNLINLVRDVSVSSIADFFKRKISSFQTEKEDFDYVLKDSDFAKFSQVQKIGKAEFDDSDELLVLSAKFNGELTERSSKKQQYEIAKKILKEDFKDGAIFVFYDDNGMFRFSFLRKNYGDKTQKFTPWRRFTYFVSPLKHNKTFLSRIDKCDFSSLDAIQDAFSVEPLSEQFYKDLSHWYFWSLNQVSFPAENDETTQIVNKNAMIRLITRLMFVWFMKQKNLIPDELFENDTIEKLLNFDDATNSTFYKAILQNLFFATLNIPMDKERKFVNRQPGVQVFYRYKRFIKNEELFFQLMNKIPFLNGGLFENLDIVKPEENIEIRIDCFSDRRDNENRLKVPDSLFFGEHRADISSYFENQTIVDVVGIIDLLNRYDFTIDENTPYDQEVALDPELLGMVFENLLASYNPETESTARKESGSFYTPRVVVDYMIEESLVNYIHLKTQFDVEKLKLLVSNTDEQPFAEEDQKKQIVQILSEIKIIDPACGSGAFPMGALQKIVHMLSKIDKDNSLWYDRQMEIAVAETAEAYKIGDVDERRQRLAIIEDAFEKGVNDPDYARKLFLIENCMYGVDIQPIAMQISKLRFFISLLVEQKLDASRPNFGIIALPNLETKFVAANTLISLPGSQSGQAFIKDLRIEKLEVELNKIRHDLFSARTSKTKEKRRKRHLEIQQEIGEILIDSGFPSEMAQAIKEWKAFSPDNAAKWFSSEWMFGIEKFDIVIGNPPYIQLQKALPGSDTLKYADVYKNEKFKTFERTGDIYALFYEKGLHLLHSKGILCYITSNKWMRAGYGKSLREFLASKTPLQLIDMGPGIFKSATVDTNILIVQNNAAKSHNLLALTLKDKHQLSTLTPQQFCILSNLGEDSWIILKPEELSIKQKIERIGKPLKDWDVSINYGIKTGFNEAFIIDRATKDSLIAQDPKSAEIIKPILRGRDIKRYKAEFADLWLLFIPWHFPLHIDSSVNGASIKAEMEFRKQYPAVFNHLLQYKEQLSKRNRAETGIRYEWYALQRCAATYYEEFEKEKIVWAETIKEYFDSSRNFPRFTIVNKNLFTDKTGFILVGVSLKYLLAILNSRVIESFLRDTVVKLGSGSMGLAKIYIETIPIPEASHGVKKVMTSLVEEIILSKNCGNDTTDLERQIDVMVYKLYELTYDEVLLVDPEFWMGREEYEQFN